MTPALAGRAAAPIQAIMIFMKIFEVNYHQQTGKNKKKNGIHRTNNKTWG